MLCNALVCIAVWLCYSARSTADRILAIVPPIAAFVAAGFEHSVANMFFIPFALLVKSDKAFVAGHKAPDLSEVTWGALPDREPPAGDDRQRDRRRADGRSDLLVRLPAAAAVTGELRLIDAYWRAANYLSVGQIYLLDNPLLREPLRSEHVKPRLLGHFGTTPGLNLIWVHLNRAIRARQLHAIYVTGPGHGGPGIVANAYLEGTYSELYPNVGPGEDGLRELFRQFSFPGGIPSHAAPETPGSIHEGGELGYALAHAYGAAYDNPDLLVCCVVGDGEAETGPLATSWHSNKFLNAVTDGAVLPVLHLNGYKIANPTVLARIPERELVALMEGYGHRPLLVSGDDPEAVHQDFAAALDDALDDISRIQQAARAGQATERPRWPMIVLRTPKGWTGPKEVDGKPVEGTWRSHQVPMSDVRGNKAHVQLLEEWMRSYRPEELFDERGRARRRSWPRWRRRASCA